MSSQRRLEANRANAKYSTGPRTQLGKARSKMNALKHGLSANAIVLEGEDPRQFEALRAGLERDFEPDSVVEFELVEHLAGLFWRRRRVPRLEAEIIKAHTQKLRELPFADCENPLGSAFIHDSAQHDALTKLSRHATALMNETIRTLHLLEVLRASRAAAQRVIESAVQVDGNSAATTPGNDE
jgi:hypothetical protein